ncbi:hypothetical protein PATSB16_23380 [Pandoraea thiooxydans]|nr:hypothetical protein PATSB16_23380 [Pandoraea thiooxydans]
MRRFRAMRPALESGLSSAGGAGIMAGIGLAARDLTGRQI